MQQLAGAIVQLIQDADLQLLGMGSIRCTVICPVQQGSGFGQNAQRLPCLDLLHGQMFAFMLNRRVGQSLICHPRPTGIRPVAGDINDR